MGIHPFWIEWKYGFWWGYEWIHIVNLPNICGSTIIHELGIAIDQVERISVLVFFWLHCIVTCLGWFALAERFTMATAHFPLGPRTVRMGYILIYASNRIIHSHEIYIYMHIFCVLDRYIYNIHCTCTCILQWGIHVQDMTNLGPWDP